jgi:hypothetical protein
MPWHVSKGEIQITFTDVSVHGRSEKIKLPLLTCQGMDDLRKTNDLYWHVRAWKIWEKQITFTDMSGHGRSEKNKLPLLTCQGMEDLRKTNYLYWHVRAWTIWEKQMTFTDMSGHGRSEKNKLPKVICFSQIFHALTCQLRSFVFLRSSMPWHVSKGNLFFSDLPCPDTSVKVICFSQIVHALTCQ